MRGGHVSIRAFHAATGIPDHQILGTYWATWNEALAEAGAATTSFFQPKIEEGLVIEALAKLIDRLKKWPAQNELILERRRNSSFPSIKVIRRVSRETSFASKLVSYCAEHPGLATAAKIAAQRMKTEEAEPPAIGRTPTSGYVYMMRSGRRYKIGYTNSPSRRHREVRLDLPDPTTLVHTIATDDPGGIEAYWHTGVFSLRGFETRSFLISTQAMCRHSSVESINRAFLIACLI